MKYLVKNKIPDLTPYVSLSYNGDVNYMPISGSGLPSTIHAEEDGLYIEKNNRIWPMTHPDLSTQPSILPLRFGKFPIYELLIPANYLNPAEHFFNIFCKDVENSFVGYKIYYNYIDEEINPDINEYSGNYYISGNYSIDPSAIILCTIKDNTWNIFNKNNWQGIVTDNYYYNACYLVYWGLFFSSGCTVFTKLIKTYNSGLTAIIDILQGNLSSATSALLTGHFIKPNPYEDNLYIKDIVELYEIPFDNIIYASAFNETNYSPITIENGIVTTELNFKPDYFLVQYFGEMDDYYYYVNNILSLHIFDWNSYKWCEGSYETLTKYCTNSSYGYEDFTDNKTELDSEDDAAYVNWGPKWRMPSKELFEELINSSYTTTTWTTMNGVNGRKITSKTNENSIFLPATGAHYDNTLTLAGLSGYYWSRALNSDIPHNARVLCFDSIDIVMTSSIRHGGLSVRPVCTDSSQTNHEYVDLGFPSGTLWATMNIGASSPEEYGLYFAWGETEGYQ